MEHPEASMYNDLASSNIFHESKCFAADGQQVVLVDIDETIAFYGKSRRYDMAKPNHDNIDKINNLYDNGWYVVYWTARGGSEKSKKAGRCYYDFTWSQLELWGCKFHDLSTGSKGKYIKPAIDLVIDDKAMTIDQLPDKDTWNTTKRDREDKQWDEYLSWCRMSENGPHE